jgi:O-antigen/teichoic acid export membrane protein
VSPARESRLRLWRGAGAVFLAEALVIPTGLATAIYLTRRLGPGSYGAFTLAASLVATVEWTTTSMLARASLQFLSEAGDRAEAESRVVRLHLLVGTVAGLLLALLAGPLAGMLGDPSLRRHFVLFALDVPLFAVAQAHRQVLIGGGAFRLRALAGSLTLIVLLVESGLSVEGAIVASIAASGVELAVARAGARPSLRPFGPLPGWGTLRYALPLALFALSLRLFDKLDLLLVKGLGGSLERAGVYGAAQNLASFPSLLAISISPLLLASLGRALRAGDRAGADALARDALRLVLILVPFASLLAGASPEVVALLFGEAYRGAAPLCAILLQAGMAMVIFSVATAVLTAGGRAGWTLALAAPLPVLALAGHAFWIPRVGAIGAAGVTLGCAVLGAVAALVAVERASHVTVPFDTGLRTMVVGAGAYTFGAGAPGGAALVGWLAAGALLVPAAYLLLGELAAEERAELWTLLRPRVGGDERGGRGVQRQITSPRRTSAYYDSVG